MLNWLFSVIFRALDKFMKKSSHMPGKLSESLGFALKYLPFLQLQPKSGLRDHRNLIFLKNYFSVNTLKGLRTVEMARQVKSLATRMTG